MDNYLSKLNPQQKDAVTYCDGPQLVIAGAGSGKTRVLTYKIIHLLNNGYKPHQILALTFTNKAAKEMRERISLLVGDEVAAKLWMALSTPFCKNFEIQCVAYRFQKRLHHLRHLRFHITHQAHYQRERT